MHRPVMITRVCAHWGKYLIIWPVPRDIRLRYVATRSYQRSVQVMYTTQGRSFVIESSLGIGCCEDTHEKAIAERIGTRKNQAPAMEGFGLVRHSRTIQASVLRGRKKRTCLECTGPDGLIMLCRPVSRFYNELAGILQISGRYWTHRKVLEPMGTQFLGLANDV
jgi:hypothetical protein